VEACEALFVGDHPEADIEGAIQAGLTAIWKFVPYWSLTASVPTIHQLSEILPYCLSGNRREPAYTLRLAAAADAEAMVRIHHAAVHETASACYPPEVLDAWASQLTEASYERMRQELATGDGRIDVVAELNSQIVGFGMVIPEGQELRAVYVDPQFGRRGVGAAILSHLEQLAIQCGIERLDLESSLNAEAFYSRHGYQVVERGMHRFRSGHQMACVVMTKSLASIGDLALRSATWTAPSA
jgi:putative acetyltransferase